MNTKTKSSARKLLEKLRGHPLSFGQMIESIRHCDEISQIQLARKLGVSRSHLCDIEKGRRPVTPDTAARFAKALGYSVNQFVARAIEDSLRRIGLKFTIEVKAA